MSTEETIFSRALAKKSAEEREAYLNDACSGDAELRANIEGLLAAHECPGGILDRAAPASDVTCDSFLSDGQNQAGTLIGPYKLLEKIGEGGMGEVYMAEQQRPVRRKVALKIIKPGMDSKQVIARFEVERQALALMDHPNIARVLDGGATESGRPYFVMELVRGVPLTEYCDQNRLTVRQRLDLFVQVCRAVQHAHQKGIIHRDLKPSNVLVTLHDTAPVPKIIDFGIAKAVGEPLTDRTLFTNYSQFIGTPLYMSPEQAGLSGLDVDTRTDIYSLGVLLYELLTGATPFDKQRLGKAAHEEIRRIIREEEPPRPSTRLSTLGETLSTISASRQIDPAKLGQIVRGELDWVVMKALEKDRKLRYETPNGLARDIERYLTDQPVEACPPSTIYRLRKFVRRNRAKVTLLGVLVLALSAVAGLLVYGSMRESRQKSASIHLLEEEQKKTRAEKAAAEDARAETDGANTFLLKMLSASDPDRFAKLDASAKPAELTVRQALDTAAKELNEGTLREHPKIEAAVRQSLGRTYNALGLFPQAEEQYRKALEIRLRLFGEREEVAEMYANLADVFWREGKPSEAEKQLRKAVHLEQELPGDHRVALAKYQSELGWVLYRKNDLQEAESYIRQALRTQRQVLGPHDPALARTLHNLAAVLKNNSAETENCLREALQIQREVLGERNPAVAINLNNLALVLQEKGEIEEAERCFRRAIEIDRGLLGKHPDLADFLSNLASLLRDKEQLTEAVTCQREALDIQRQFATEPNLSQVDNLYEMGALLNCAGNRKESENAYREALGLQLELHQHPDLRGRVNELAYLLELKGDHAGVIQLYRDCVEVESRLDEHGSATLEAKEKLALNRIRQGGRRGTEILQELARDLRKAIEFRQKHLGTVTTRPAEKEATEKQIAQIRNRLADCEAAIGELRESPGPFGKSASAVPGIVQAEDFDRGGLGVAYWDASLESSFDGHPSSYEYRATAVDLDTCRDEGGGLNIGFTQAGEWLNYTVEVAESGAYDVEFRVACIRKNAAFHLEFSGLDVTGPILSPNTGDWQVWQTVVRRGVPLKAGRQVMRLVFDRNCPAGEYACNVNWIRISKAAK